MPSSSAGVIANTAALIRGKTVINLNFTASKDALVAAINKAEIDTVITSHKFISKLESKGFDVSLLQHIKYVLYAVKLLPATWLNMIFAKKVALADPAIILFSSGSEGDPKGVLLSQHNVMSNIKQVADVLNT